MICVRPAQEAGNQPNNSRAQQNRQRIQQQLLQLLPASNDSIVAKVLQEAFCISRVQGLLVKTLPTAEVIV